MPSARRRWVEVLVGGLFLLILGGAGAMDLIVPAPGPALLRHDRTARRRAYWRSSVWDGTLMRVIDRNRQEHSNLRNALVPWYILSLLMPLREGGSGVLVGKDGWLYLRDRITPDVTGHRSDHAPIAANVLSAIDRRLAAFGVRALFLPLPRKATITPEFAPAGSDTRPEFERELLGELERRRVPHVNLYREWQGYDGVELWKRRDTHWSGLAKWLALEACVRALGSWVPPAERETRLMPQRIRPAAQALLMTLGIPREHPVMKYLPPDPMLKPMTVRRTMDRLPPEPRTVLVGTSFTNNSIATDLVAHLTNAGVLNLGQGGRNLGRTLAEALGRGRISPGIDVIVEIPAYQLQRVFKSKDGMSVIAHSLVQPLADAPVPDWDLLPMELEVLAEDAAGLSAGRLATSSDGIVHVQLSERPSGGEDLMIVVRSGGYESITPWPQAEEFSPAAARWRERRCAW